MSAIYSFSLLVDSIKGTNLDKVLEVGMFRNGSRVFTTTFIQFDFVIYSTYWLRIDLNKYQQSKSQQEMSKRNTRFKQVIDDFVLDQEKENLFLKYKAATPFISSPSLHFLLNDSVHLKVYDTKSISLYDGDKLISCGIFDAGKKSAAGITCFFDPDYKKYSLGIYMMLQKMEYCKSVGMEWFYPGYVAPGCTAFDYKLLLARNHTQFLDVHNRRWIDIAAFNQLPNLYKTIEAKLKFAKDIVNLSPDRNSKFYQYYFFDSNLYLHFLEEEAFTFPCFILLSKKNKDYYVLVYDTFGKKYTVLIAYLAYQSHGSNQKRSIFDKCVLGIRQVLFTSQDIYEVGSFVFKNVP